MWRRDGHGDHGRVRRESLVLVVPIPAPPAGQTVGEAGRFSQRRAGRESGGGGGGKKAGKKGGVAKGRDRRSIRFAK